MRRETLDARMMGARRETLDESLVSCLTSHAQPTPHPTKERPPNHD